MINRTLFGAVLFVSFALPALPAMAGACAELGVDCSHPNVGSRPSGGGGGGYGANINGSFGEQNFYTLPFWIIKQAVDGLDSDTKDNGPKPDDPHEIARQQAVALINQAMQSSNLDTQIELIQRALAIYDYPPTREWLNKALAIKAANLKSEALFNLADKAYQAGDYERAVSLLEEELQVSPNDPEIKSNIVSVKAMAQAQASHSAAIDAAKNLDDLGRAAYASGDYAGAAKLFAQAGHILPGNSIYALELTRANEPLQNRHSFDLSDMKQRQNVSNPFSISATSQVKGIFGDPVAQPTGQDLEPVENRGTAKASGALDQLSHGTNGTQTNDQTFDNGLGPSTENVTSLGNTFWTPPKGSLQLSDAQQKALDADPQYKPLIDSQKDAEKKAVEPDAHYQELENQREAHSELMHDTKFTKNYYAALDAKTEADNTVATTKIVAQERLQTVIGAPIYRNSGATTNNIGGTDANNSSGAKNGQAQ